MSFNLKYQFLLAATLVGLASLILSRLVPPERRQISKFLKVSESSATMCLTLGAAGSMLLTLHRLLVGDSESSLLGLLGVQFVSAGLGIVLSRENQLRRLFATLAGMEVILFLLVVNALMPFTLLQQGELLMTIAGLVMVVSGYIGWYRERDRQEDWVSFNLAFGSLLAAVPMTIGLLAQRIGDYNPSAFWQVLHESGTLVIGLGLLASGILCRIRWSTLVGGATMGLYVVSLIGLIRLPEQLQSTAVYMMVGGGLLFGTTVLLSVYRDRLLSLPKRMQEGEGVFQVLKWR